MASRAWSLTKRIVLCFLGISIFLVLLFRWVPIPGTPLMIIRSFESENEKHTRRYDWKSLDEISPNLHLAVVCTEDQNFLKHHGLDFGAIEKAIKNEEGRSRRRGASTITQQVAKNVFLWPGRSWVRKGLETYFALMIDLLWSKQRIMEVYLNVIEMGDGIYGAEAASQFYFTKPASQLTKTQAATIASILPNPRRYSASRPGPYVQSRIQWTLQQMRFWGGALDWNKGKKKRN